MSPKDLSISRTSPASAVRADRLLALYHFSKSLAGEQATQEAVLAMTADHAFKFFDGVLIALINPSARNITPRAARHKDGEIEARLERSLGRPIDLVELDALAEVENLREPLLLKPGDNERVDRILGWLKDRLLLEYQGQLLISPFFAHGRTKGLLLGFISAKSGEVEEANLEFWKDFSTRAALAVDTADLIGSLKQELYERSKIEQELQQREALFRTVFEASALGIKVLEPSGEISLVNPALEEILGRNAAEIEGNHFNEFTYESDRTRSQRFFDELLQDGIDSWVLTKRYQKPSGTTVWAKLTFTLVKDRSREVDLIVGIVEDITQQRQMQSEIHEMRAMLIESAENERLRLAQDLHDGPMQELHSITYQLESAWGESANSTLEEAIGIKESLQAVIQALRDTSKELRPPALLEFGLVKAIRSHAKEAAEEYPKLKIHLELAEDRELLEERIRLGFFRIYQNSLMNVVRHAEAKNVWVRFKWDAERASLVVEDDGKGFDVPENWIDFVRSGHFGLAGAAERAQALGGDMTVVSSPEKGTCIRVVLAQPLNLKKTRSKR